MAEGADAQAPKAVWPSPPVRPESPIPYMAAEGLEKAATAAGAAISRSRHADPRGAKNVLTQQEIDGSGLHHRGGRCPGAHGPV